MNFIRRFQFSPGPLAGSRGLVPFDLLLSVPGARCPVPGGRGRPFCRIKLNLVPRFQFSPGAFAGSRDWFGFVLVFSVPGPGVPVPGGRGGPLCRIKLNFIRHFPFSPWPLAGSRRLVWSSGVLIFHRGPLPVPWDWFGFVLVFSVPKGRGAGPRQQGPTVLSDKV